MTSSNALTLDPATNDATGEWMHFGADPRFDYPIDYAIRILGASAATGTVDFLGKWAPNSYCHFHKHLGNTTSLVLEGEHHTVETVAGESIHKVRQAGDYAQKPGGDVHMEFAGPQGSVVFFSMQAVDGKLFEVLGRGERVLNVTTLEDFLAGNLPR
jgi:quercetin dioxygenase-like cupin family protein